MRERFRRRGGQGRLRYVLQGREKIVSFPKKKRPISPNGLFFSPPPPESVSAESFPEGVLNKPKGMVDDGIYLSVIDRAMI